MARRVDAVTKAAPTRKDHDTFCRVEEWRPVRDACERTGAHHVTCELDLPDGRILRTRISHPVDRSNDGQSMWRHILHDQLQVDKADFWACVHDGVKPHHGLLIEHEVQPSDNCRICPSAWPCPVVTTIHALVKDSDREYVALVRRAHGDE